MALTSRDHTYQAEFKRNKRKIMQCNLLRMVCCLSLAASLGAQQPQAGVEGAPFLLENHQRSTIRTVRDAIFNVDTIWSVLDIPDIPPGAPPPPPPGSIVTPLPLPELPLEESDAVIVGRIVALQPFLTGDKKALYVEHTIAVSEVIKSAPVSHISNQLTILRLGGVARLPGSGRTVKWDVTGEGAPLSVEQEYLFFLQYRKDGDCYLVLRMWHVDRGVIKAAYPADQERARQFKSENDGKSLAQIVSALKIRASKP